MRKQKTMIDVWEDLSAKEKQHLIDAFLWVEKPMTLGQLALVRIDSVEKVLAKTPMPTFGGIALYNKIRHFLGKVY